MIHWLGEERSVYAVNAGEQILFANESGDFLRFKGNQIVEVRNLLSYGQHVHISHDGSQLRYVVDRGFVAAHNCEKWTRVKVRETIAITVFEQQCRSDKGRYSNEYSINRGQQLVQLTFLIHPNFPPVRIALAKR